MAIEEPRFEVVDATDAFELRAYAPFLVAETVVDADFDGAGNQGFRRLADFIFGNNRARTEIEMTAPVTQRPSAKIAMTAPVLQRGSAEGAGAGGVGGDVEGDERFVVGFVMPAEYTVDTLPEPVRDDVAIREAPPRLVAARRYSGRWSETRFREHEAELRAALAEAGLRPVADAEYARYDPPFMPWFLRRNEVLIEVERVD